MPSLEIVSVTSISVDSEITFSGIGVDEYESNGFSRSSGFSSGEVGIVETRGQLRTVLLGLDFDSSQWINKISTRGTLVVIAVDVGLALNIREFGSTWHDS